MSGERFARIVFAGAGAWGVAAAALLYLGMGPPAAGAAGAGARFYAVFLVITLVWQFAFFLIAADPARYRALMVLAMLEELSFCMAMPLLAWLRIAPWAAAVTAAPAAALLALFWLAWRRTMPAAGTG